LRNAFVVACDEGRDFFIERVQNPQSRATASFPGFCVIEKYFSYGRSDVWTSQDKSTH